MPYQNEHSARIRDPEEFNPNSFRRTYGGKATLPGAGLIDIPETVAIIWGKLKKNEDFPIVQALRFPTRYWTSDEALEWLEKHKVKYILFEEAKKMERRTLENACNYRQLDDNNVIIEGYAALFNVESRDLGGFTEVILKGAFNNCDMSDVVATFNHDNNIVLARRFQDQGSLTLNVDEKGLKYSFVAPSHTWGEYLTEAIKRGDIRHSSFAFTIKEQKFEKKEKIMRYITKFQKIYDISPVTDPAYYETNVDIRSLKSKIELQKMKLQLLNLKC